jgi:hypothetical protein
MKRILYLLCFFCTLASYAQKQLYPYSDGTKWGLTNEKLEVVMTPQFDRPPRIVKAKFAVVQKDSNFGVVNHKGKTILPIQYSELIELDGETSLAILNGKYIFIDLKTWRQISQFDYASDCKCPEKLHVVTKDGKTGFLNIVTREFVGGLIYEDVSLLKYYPRKGKAVRFPGLAEVRKDGKYGVLNLSTGTNFLDTKYDRINGVIENGRMFIDGSIGIDQKRFDLKGNEIHVEQTVVVAGEEVISEPTAVYQEEEDSETTTDLYAAGNIGQEGWTVTIERTRGKKTEVLESHFVDGYEIVGKLYYDSAEGPSTARIKGVKTNPNISISVMDIKGNVLARFDYDNIEYKNGCYTTRLRGKYGLVTTDFVEIKKPVLEDVFEDDYYNPSINALFIEMPSGQQGYMDKKTGKIFIPGVSQ